MACLESTVMRDSIPKILSVFTACLTVVWWMLINLHCVRPSPFLSFFFKIYLVFSSVSNALSSGSHITICQFDIFIPLPCSVKGWAATDPTHHWLLSSFCQPLLLQSLFLRAPWHNLTKDIAVTEPFLLAQTLPFHARDDIYRITQMNTSSKGCLNPTAIFALSFCTIDSSTRPALVIQECRVNNLAA